MSDNDTPLNRGNDTPPPADGFQRTARDERGLRTTGPGMIQYIGRTRMRAVAGERGRLRAADTDRNRVVELLNIAYGEGRLSKDEFDDRLENAFSARTYADLDQIVADLPAARPAVAAQVARTNGLAVASLACGLAQFVFGPLATIPAIVLGHVARQQIRRTGEQGAGLALAGLVLGWAAVILAIVLIVVIGLAMSTGMQAPMQ